MIIVGCWLGRIALHCTLCDWQDPPVDATRAEESRRLVELVELSAVHVATEHPREHRSTYVTVPPNTPIEVVPGARIMHTQADAVCLVVEVGEHVDRSEPKRLPVCPTCGEPHDHVHVCAICGEAELEDGNPFECPRGCTVAGGPRTEHGA